MRKERKQELMHSFPAVPHSVEEQMKGKGALNFCVFLTNGHELFVRCFHRYKNGELAERQRYVFAKDGAVRYILDGYSTTKWKVATEFKEPRFAAKGYPYTYRFDNTYAILNANAYRQSDMKYSQVGGEYFRCPLSYLKLYIKHPNLEYLIKSGYGHLIEENHNYYNDEITVEVNHRVDLKSNNLLKMLGLNRTEFKVLQGHEKSYSSFLLWREEYPKLKPQDWLTLAITFYSEHGTLQRFIEQTGLKPVRLARYLRESDVNLHDYSDYLQQCRQLGYPLRDTAINMPHDFYAMHERLSMLIQTKANESLMREFRKNYTSRKRLEYESGSLILVQPESIDEIANEGKTLCHCVGGYAERHAKGITNILFLRRKSEPDKPFYTVEVSRELKVMQCYGYKNNKAGNDKPPEIEAFEKDYQHYLEELKREQKRNKQKLQQSA